jgi:hypothetical protein
MNIKNIIFISMFLLYLYIIYKVYNFYNNSIDHSISSIIKDDVCNKIIFKNMLIMGFLTLTYELYRNDIISFLSILFLLIGIYGVLLYDHIYYITIHFFFCFIVFISIFIFMYHQSRKRNDLYLRFLFDLFIIICLQITSYELLYIEMALLFIFAVFYISLHFYSYINA